MARTIGIDLGTTSSRVAIVQDGIPVIIENSEGEGTTPSHIAFPSERACLVGEAARRYALQSPANVAYCYKRLIGRRFLDPEVQQFARFAPFRIAEGDDGDAWVELGGRLHSPSELSAYMLLRMVRTAEQHLGEKVSRAVISVPAYFNDRQRQATKDAARLAGLEVPRLIAEPVAAALAYGFGDRKKSKTVVAFDLGGGTLDVSVMEIGDGVFEVKSTNGDTFLGGEDFDYALTEHVAHRYGSRTGINLFKDAVAMHRLKYACEIAKINLSAADSTNIELPFIHYDGNASHHLSEIVTRKEFEELLKTFLDRAITVCDHAIKDSFIDARNEVDAVVLIGGSTRIPLVQRRLAEYFGKPALGTLRREDAVALGAAIQSEVVFGKRIRDVLLLDVTSHSLGIETLGGVFTRLIERNTVIPTKKSQVFSTVEDGQNAVTISVSQGEREMAADNRPLAQFDLVGIPPAPRGVPQIEVTFDIDVNGIVHVLAKDKATTREQSIIIQPSGGLSEEKISHIAKVVQSTEIVFGLLAEPVAHAATPAPLQREDPAESPAVSVASVARPPKSMPHVFVSYAREDALYASSIEKAISVLVRNGRIGFWVDRRLQAGDQWQGEIFSAIERSNVVVLLLSNDFLSSDFIASKELPAIFAEKERRRLTLFPILVRPCAFELHADLAKFQLFNNPDAPFSALRESEVETELARLARELGRAAA